jgi:hypothetical protein
MLKFSKVRYGNLEQALFVLQSANMSYVAKNPNPAFGLDRISEETARDAASSRKP